MRWPFVLLAVIPAFIFVAACGDDDGAAPDGGAATETPTRAPRDPLRPPFEGPPRKLTEERTDFREDPAWRPPDPGSRPPRPEDSEDVIFSPPSAPTCPEDWVVFRRPSEGFSICHPEDWEEISNVYVNSPNEERWYAVGFFDFPGGDQEHQLAHVSIYVFPQFSQPVRYTVDCIDAYSVTFAGEPAVICADFPAVPPEARIVSYHVFRNDVDFFVNIAAYLEYDEEKGEYRDSLDEESLMQAIEIAHTFQFLESASAQ